MRRLPLLLMLLLILPTLSLSEALPALPGLDDDASELRFPTEDIVLTLGGDAVLGTRESWWSRADALPAYLSEHGYGYCFSALQGLFASDDITFINLEGVLKDGSSGENTSKQYRFRGLPEWTEVLHLGSIELVNIANNHYIDYGTKGRDATRAALDADGIPYSGYEYTYVYEVRGHKIGFGGCRETVWLQDADVIARDCDALRRAGAEVILYACHWGTEYAPTHNETQQQMAKACAEAGVDIVIGAHPHVVQGIGTVGDTVVLWSLGNLMFGGTIDMTTFDATLARLTLHFDLFGYSGCTLRFVPILTSSRAAEGVNDYQPVIAEGDDRARIMALIQADSDMAASGDMEFPR